MDVMVNVPLNCPRMIGVCGDVMEYCGMDEYGRHTWIYGKKIKSAGITLDGHYHLVEGRYNGKVVYANSGICDEDTLYGAIEGAAQEIEIRYQMDGLYDREGRE